MTKANHVLAGVLLVTQDETTRDTVCAALENEGEACLVAVEAASALAIVGESHPRLAIIDLGFRGTAAVALVHHLVALDPSLQVAALALPSQFAAAGEALALGASALLVAPVTGDAVLRVLADVRARTALAEQISRYQAELRDLEDLTEAMTESLAAAPLDDPHALDEALVGTLQLASGARGVALYGAAEGGTSRRAGYGTALELREQYDDDASLARAAAARGAELHYLRGQDGDERAVVLERALPGRAERTKKLLYYAARLLPLRGSGGKGGSAEDASASGGLSFPSMGRRIDEALRGAGARCVVLAFLPPEGRAVDEAALAPVLREPGSAFATAPDGSAFVLLPEIDASTARALLVQMGLPVAGIAEAPSDGTAVDPLFALARVRASEARYSPVRTLVGTSSLLEMLDGLLATSMLDAHASSAYPLDLSLDAMRSLVLHAMHQALFARATSVSVSHRGPFGLDAMVRDACKASPGLVHRFDLRASNAADMEVLLVESPRATWVLCGRKDKERLRAVHSSDPLLLALIADGLRRLPELSA